MFSKVGDYWGLKLRQDAVGRHIMVEKWSFITNKFIYPNVLVDFRFRAVTVKNFLSELISSSYQNANPTAFFSSGNFFLNFLIFHQYCLVFPQFPSSLLEKRVKMKTVFLINKNKLFIFILRSFEV